MARPLPPSLNPNGPPTVMKPEGSRKVCVLNGSRQIDQVVKGEWMTLKVLPENGLPKGIYQLGDAIKPQTGIDGKEGKAYSGQLLHVDDKAVYQFGEGKSIVKHDRAAFRDLEAKGEKLTVGQAFNVGYDNGRATVAKGHATAHQAQPQKQRGAGHSL